MKDTTTKKRGAVEQRIKKFRSGRKACFQTNTALALLLFVALILALCAGCSSESFEPGIVYTCNRVVGDELVVAELWLADAATGIQRKVRDIREDFLDLRPAGPGRMSIYFSSGELHVVRLADGRMELAAKPAAPAGTWRDFRLASPDLSRLAAVEIPEVGEALWYLDTESGRGVKVAQPYYGLSGMHWNRNRPGTLYFAAHDEGQDAITKADCADSGTTEILFTSEARTTSFRFSDDEQTLAVCYKGASGLYFLDVYKDGEKAGSLESKDSLVLMDLSPDGSQVLYLADIEGEMSTLMVYFVGEERSQVIREGVIMGYGWFLPAEDE